MTKKNILINLLWTFLYALLTLFFVLHHEIWADEAQVWLIVKNLSIPEMLKHLVNEGHPCFFYLLVYPLAKLNFSIFSMQILCWLSCAASVFLLLTFSPFNRFYIYADFSGYTEHNLTKFRISLSNFKTTRANLFCF